MADQPDRLRADTRTLELLEQLLGDDELDLPPKTREAFGQFRAILMMNQSLTVKQKQWVQNVAHQKQLIGDPGASNLFSNLSPARQAEQRARAAKVLLPWERKK